MAVCVFCWMLTGRPEKLDAEWLKLFLESSLYVLAAMWPIYLAWVVLSKRLTLQEKFLWLFIIVFLNMAGMPMFYVFMLRRYLGIEGRTGPRDEAALDSFLARCGIGRDALSADQVGVLRSYCRRHRLVRLGVWPAFILAPLAIYCAAVSFPNKMIPMFKDFSQTHLIVIDTATHARKEVLPDPEMQRQYVELVMGLGAMAGIVGMMGVSILCLALFTLGPNWHRKALMAFLKAGKEEHRAIGRADSAGIGP